MIDKTSGIIAQMARRGAALSMLVVLASCDGGLTTEQEAARRPSARAEAFFKRAEAAEVARKAAIAGKPQPSDAGAQFPFQLDEAAKEAPFLIEAMWQDQFFTYLRTKTQKRIGGCVATFKKRQESDWSSRPGSASCSHLEQLVDELNLSPNIRTAHPPRLPLPDHVHCLVSLDRSARRVEFTKALLGLHSSFDRSMILLQDIVQVLDRPVATTASQNSFFFHSWNRRAVEACLIGVDDAGMRMRWIAESLAKQPFGRRGIA